MGILNSKKILISIILFTLISRLYRLDYPKNYVFDEVYHAFTAKEFLKGSTEAWEWWTIPPPGVAYEWTHPPLAKEIMAVSMLITRSQDAWAWRLPGVLLGVLSVFVVYKLGLKLFQNNIPALLAAFLFSIDGLNFVQSRIGMNDIYFVTFMLLSLLFLLNKRCFLSAIFFGLAFSSKWAAIYLLLLVFFFLYKEGLLKKLPKFFTISATIYLLSYLPFFLLDHNFSQFIELQQQMWWYHTGLRATHSYSSPWWSWPFNLYPVWYFVDYSGDKVANIFASGNPAVFWVGIVAMVLTIWQTIKEKSVNLLIILLGFFVFWLPWIISPRIMFLYHYAPSIPFLALSLGHQLSLGLKERGSRKLVIALLILMVLSFILIYPFLTAIPLPRELVKFFFTINLSKNPF